MKERTMKMKRGFALFSALLLLCISIPLISILGRSVPADDFTLKLEAAERMEACMKAVAGYKAERGIRLSELDFHQTGMIGVPFNSITTTLGAVEAKRTTANGDMAALAVQLLEEAGVSAGDVVGAGFSGSFPALNLAVLSACAAMDVQIVYISSVGASTYGANNPELTFPDMAYLLVEDGLLPTHSAAITLGGEKDCGLDMDRSILASVEQRIGRYGIPVLKMEDYGENIAARMNIYDSAGPIKCFIGVGGNITTLGREYLDLGQGLISPGYITDTDEQSGLLERYSAQGLPVIHLLNLKRLVADYGLAYDPAVLPERGTSAIYYRMSYSRALIAGVFAAELLLLFLLYRLRSDARRKRK